MGYDEVEQPERGGEKRTERYQTGRPKNETLMNDMNAIHYLSKRGVSIYSEEFPQRIQPRLTPKPRNATPSRQVWSRPNSAYQIHDAVSQHGFPTTINFRHYCLRVPWYTTQSPSDVGSKSSRL